jgi:hypothetical protein
MTWLLPVFVAIAVCAWGAAVWSALAIVQLAPRGTKIARYYDLGFWRFGKIASALGPAAAPHLARYRTAFMVFFGAILAVALTAIIASS